MKSLICILVLSIQLMSLSQEVKNKSLLSIPEIMNGQEFIGFSPENITWSRDGDKIIFDQKQGDMEPSLKLFYTLATKSIDTVPYDVWYKTAPQNDISPLTSKLDHYIYNGNLYYYHKKRKYVESIYVSNTEISNLQRIPNSDYIIFQMKNALYSCHEKTNQINQLIEFKTGNASGDKHDFNFITNQQEELFEFLKDKKKAASVQEKTNDLSHPRSPIVYISESSVDNIQISGDGKFITFRLTEYPTNANTAVEHYITENGYTKSIPARPKVGAKNPTHKLGIYSRESDSVYYVDFSSLSTIRNKPAYLKDYGDSTKVFDNDRAIIMHSLVYSFDGKHNVLEIKSYDNKDRWIASINLDNGEIREIEHQHDDAWIGGPGISGWNVVEGKLGWFKDNNWIYFQSEESGYSHLYSLHTATLEKRPLTSGNWEVHDAILAENGYLFYITANKNHPGNREFYHLDLRSKELKPILIDNGAVEVFVSPDERHLAYLYSTKNQPWELYITKNEAGAPKAKITNSQHAQFQKYEWADPKVITFKAKDGVDVYARVYEPESVVKNNAAIIFVHGAGYLQNAHNYWSNYYREYMFHNLLKDNGFTVLDIDYRASEGYGRDWRTGIYRHMGGLDLSDQLDGRKYLINELGIDSTRLGIYGGSYGGFITLMALLTEPGKFKCGAALRSVTDWAHYNHEYTSNILNEPSSDPEAYKKSSPIYFADNLSDRLLILHGMVDDNVQFQDVVRLSQRFIELKKENWEMSVYPAESHSFKRTDSWTDEYKRIYKLFYEELILQR